MSTQSNRSVLALSFVALLCAACASAYNSGVSEKGPNTYNLTVRTPNSKGGGNESLRQATTQANEYCGKSSRKAELTAQEVGPVTADIFFTCVAN